METEVPSFPHRFPRSASPQLCCSWVTSSASWRKPTKTAMRVLSNQGSSMMTTHHSWRQVKTQIQIYYRVIRPSFQFREVDTHQDEEFSLSKWTISFLPDIFLWNPSSFWKNHKSLTKPTPGPKKCQVFRNERLLFCEFTSQPVTSLEVSLVSIGPDGFQLKRCLKIDETYIVHILSIFYNYMNYMYAFINVYMSIYICVYIPISKYLGI